MARRKKGLSIRGYSMPSAGVIQVDMDGEHQYEIQVNEDEGVVKLWLTDPVGNTIDLPLADIIEKLYPGYYAHIEKVVGKFALKLIDEEP